MHEVHPAFDPVTSTWFVDGNEAPTIRALLAKMGGDVVAIGYKPIGAVVPLVVREPHDRSALGRSFNLAVRSTIDYEDSAHVAMGRLSQVVKPRHVAQALLDKTFGVGINAPAREATAAERVRWTDIENEILDCWARGLNGPTIAKQLGVKVTYVSSNVIWKARISGDPRAVVRCPNAIGVSHNRPVNNSHRSSRNRAYKRIVGRL